MTVRGSGFLTHLPETEGVTDRPENTCYFNTIKTTATILSDTQLSCVTPKYLSGDVQISVTLYGISAIFIESGNTFYGVNYLPVDPLIMRPLGGSITGGTNITIENVQMNVQMDGQMGENDMIFCFFGPYISTSESVSVSWSSFSVAVVVSDTSVTCVTPTAPVIGTVTVSLSINGIISDIPNNFRYQASSSIVAVVPSYGSTTGGTVVVVYGVSFESSVSASCVFGDVTVIALVVNSTAIECETPSVSMNSTVAVRIILDDIQLNMDDVFFTYRDQAVITTISPTYGTVSGGTKIKILGYGFQVSDISVCQFGSGGSSKVQYISEVEAICISPPSFEGVITLTIQGDSIAPIGIVQVDYQYLQAPRVYSVTPSLLPLGKSMTVRVKGDGFQLPLQQDNSKETVCIFGEYSVTARIISNTEIDCDSPVLFQTFSGQLRVEVQGLRALGNPLSRYVVSSSIVAVVPSYGSTTGGTVVVVYGVSFESSASASCVFGDVSVTALVVNSTAIECESPASIQPSTVPLSVSIDGYVISSYLLFSYISPSVTTTISPLGGWTIGGTNVTVTGTGYSNGAIQCHFGQVTTVGHFSSSEKVYCIVPSQSVGSVYFSISVDGITSTDLNTNTDPARRRLNTDNAISSSSVSGSGSFVFSYYQSPTVFSVSPKYSWINQSTAITISGEHFLSSTVDPVLDLELVLSSQWKCNFGQISVTATVLSDSILTCDTGLTQNIGQTKLQIVYVGNNNPLYTTDFFFYEKPVVSNVRTSLASSQGGALLKIFGDNLLANGVLSCQFGIVTVDVLVDTENIIYCRVPPIIDSEIMFTLYDQYLGTIYSTLFQILDPPILLNSVYEKNYLSVTINIEGRKGLLVRDSMRDVWYCTIDNFRTKALYVGNGRFLCSTFSLILSDSVVVILKDESGDFESNSMVVSINNTDSGANNGNNNGIRNGNMDENEICNCDLMIGNIHYNTDYFSNKCRQECSQKVKEISPLPRSTFSSMNIFNIKKSVQPSVLLNTIVSTYDDSYLDNYNQNQNSGLQYFNDINSNNYNNYNSDQKLLPSDYNCIINKNISCIVPLSFKTNLFSFSSTPFGAKDYIGVGKNKNENEENGKLKNVTSGGSRTFSGTFFEKTGFGTGMKGTERTVNKKKLLNYLIIDSVNPVSLSIKNYTWVAVTGRGFNNDTKCYFNNITAGVSYYISNQFMQCVVPPMALLNTWEVRLSLKIISTVGTFTGAFTGINSINTLNSVSEINSINSASLFYSGFGFEKALGGLSSLSLPLTDKQLKSDKQSKSDGQSKDGQVNTDIAGGGGSLDLGVGILDGAPHSSGTEEIKNMLLLLLLPTFTC